MNGIAVPSTIKIGPRERRWPQGASSHGKWFKVLRNQNK